MQLTKIKLSGFKSFVDPTTIPLESNSTAIVGPNGCGKSNIIDAVTWAMGESSPKYLRGESSTDVIFNGSTARKPVGQASVELVFDNSEGKIGGEYAKFAEISIRRQINRDAESVYFLNGVRCRKRDVVDIFLGTGLGPRSYPIVGQNMITRIIEAKPDDMRAYLEEAAGISKYKERRHETELRINHTKENLARVNDLRLELEKQLSHLKHQANVAEKFKILKQQERVLKAEFYGIQWRQYDAQMVDYTLQIQREETALEARQSELITTDRDIEQLRHEQRVANDAFQEVQRRYYSVGNEITRIEQDILHHQERQAQWENDLKQSETDWQTTKDQIDESDDDSQSLEKEILSIEPQLATVSKEMIAGQNKLAESEEQVQDWQAEWDEFNRLSAKTTQTAQVEQTRIQHLEQNIITLKNRQEQLEIDQGRLNYAELNNEIESLSNKSYELSEKLELQHDQLENIRQDISTLQATQQDSTKRLDNVRSDSQRLRGEQASLEALQQTALGQRDNPTTAWVNKHGMTEKPRLAQNIQVEEGWDRAVEKVLGVCLQAICVDDLASVVPQLDELKTGNLCLYNTARSATDTSTVKADLLLSKVKADVQLESLFAGIYTADSIDEALRLCHSLAPNESVVTREGVWLNRDWIKIMREEDPAAGVFQREQELKKLAGRIADLQDTQTELERHIEQRREQIHTSEINRDQLQQAYNQLQSQAAQTNAQLKVKQERLAELKAQSERYLKEHSECMSQLKHAQNKLDEARELWQQAMSDLENQAASRDQLTADRDQARLQLQTIRETVREKQELKHSLDLRLQTAKSQQGTIKQNMGRMHQQLSQLHERKLTLQSELSSMPHVETLKKTLSRTLDKHVSIEAELNTARIAMESLDQEYRNLETKRQAIDHDIEKVRNRLEKLRVECQGLKVKTETIAEQIKETEFTLEDILKDLQPDIVLEECQSRLEQISQRIARLGPINLVAIDEFATCSERKQYLDKQIEDLQSGLATLEDAIDKIDRETKARFKETFDKVNERFQELFPTVFGGGKAYLELTSDNLLEAGVTLMACPPGKRNSTIYLLSGGEKSLTAIAFIFSIFYLNPAPFCLLDEVDAALDDANVLRFTRLVKTMAEKTQFIFISHNKITIEMGQHLIGVTMNEPGVSRLVSVDIEKAINLAGA